MPQFLDVQDADFEARFAALLGGMKREDSPDVDATVAGGIIADVRARGDAAVIELTSKFDKLDLTPETLAFSREEIEAQIATVPPTERAALELAAARIKAYHARQIPQDDMWQDETGGATLGWRWTPVSAAGGFMFRRAGELPFLGLDECDSRQGGGRRAAGGCLPDAERRCEPAGFAGG